MIEYLYVYRYGVQPTMSIDSPRFQKHEPELNKDQNMVIRSRLPITLFINMLRLMRGQLAEEIEMYTLKLV